MTMGIRATVLLLALTPATLIAVLLVTYLTNTRIQDLERSLIDRGQAIANQLAPACEYGVIGKKLDVLNKLARSILAEPDVTRVTIRDHQGTALVDMSQPLSPPANADSAPGSQSPGGLPPLIFAAPIYATQPEVIGRVSLEISRDTLTQRQQEVIITSILLTVGCLILAAFLGQRIGRKVADPILRLEHVVRDLRDGRLDVSIQEFSSGELGSLERGVNSMALALKASHERLQEQVSEATAELRQTLKELEVKNAELEAAQKKALEISRIKSEFLANMSHEIRTPMNGVMGFITLLSKTELKRTQRAYLQTLRASAENLMVILNDILDLSKIEAGKFKIRRRTFDLRQVLEDAVLLFAPNAHQKGLSLILDIDPDVPSNLVGDAPRIAQIVTNFVSNAVKFTDEGSIEVRVSKAQESPRAVTLHLKISDTGIGIAPEDQKRLFIAFDQLDTSAGRRQGGTGLGLAISRRLVSMMEGKIYVESRLGEGTIFGVSLVIDKQEDLPIASMDPRASRASVLVVSRDSGFSRATAHILEFGGVRPVCVSGLAEAADYIASPLSAKSQLRGIILDQSCVSQDTGAVKSALGASRCEPQCVLIVMGGNEDQRNTAPYPQFSKATRFADKPPTSRELLPLLGLHLQPTLTPVDGSDQSIVKEATIVSKESVTVLLADDNRINRQLARIFLDQLGVRVYEAQSGVEVLEMTRNRSYDLILMDIHMPQLDGLTATRQLRAQADNPNRNTPVVALTADALARERDRYLEAGMNDHICKPITEGTLQQLLGKWCPAYPDHHAAAIKANEVRAKHDA